MNGSREESEVTRAVPGSYTAGLGGTYGEMIVGPEILNRGKLLKRNCSPVLIEVDNVDLKLFVCGKNDGEESFAVGHIATVEYRLLILTSEVLGDLGKNGKNEILIAEDSGRFKTTGVGYRSYVEGSVNLLVSHLDVDGVMIVRIVEEGSIEACSVNAEFVSSGQRIVFKGWSSAT